MKNNYQKPRINIVPLSPKSSVMDETIGLPNTQSGGYKVGGPDFIKRKGNPNGLRFEDQKSHSSAWDELEEM